MMSTISHHEHVPQEWDAHERPLELDSYGFPNIPLGDVRAFGQDDYPQWIDMVPFWSAYTGWFETRGYRLHEIREGVLLDRMIAPAHTTPWSRPYADRCPDDKPIAMEMPLKIVGAQDKIGRDVTVKLVNTSSDEYHIYQRLLHSPELFAEDFEGVLPPVAILDTSHAFSFVIMPTWGQYNPLYTFEAVGQALRFMHCILKGLNALHNRRIAHQDVDEHNIMTSLYSLGAYSRNFAQPLRDYRRCRNPDYCLFDFDRSVFFSEDWALRDCRLPVELKTVERIGTPFRPLDLSLGGPYYSPFALDVACLGNLFRASFSSMIPHVPMLAPLFDKMTTHIQSQRFSAHEALTFFEHACDQAPAATLNMSVKLDADWKWVTYDRSIYWTHVPSQEASRWSSYQTPVLPRWIRWMFRYARSNFWWNMLRLVRQTLQI